MALDVRRASRNIVAVLILLFLAASSLYAAAPRTPISLRADDVLPTGNQWISLPDIRASDGALGTFNFLSMRHRGLLQVSGDKGSPVLQPYFSVAGKPLAFHNPTWELIQYWIPSAHLTVDGLDATLTWCAPPESRAAFLRMTLTNRRTAPAEVALGVRAAFAKRPGTLSRLSKVFSSSSCCNSRRFFLVSPALSGPILRRKSLSLSSSVSHRLQW